MVLAKNVAHQLGHGGIRTDEHRVCAHYLFDQHAAQLFTQGDFPAAGLRRTAQEPADEGEPYTSEEITGKELKEPEGNKPPAEKLPHRSRYIGRSDKTAGGAPEN